MKIKLDLEKVFNETEKGRSLARRISQLVHQTRQEEKRKWFKKLKTEKFWKNLTDGSDGPEGIEYATDVYIILDDLLGPRG
jgi:hypothetical protein